MTNEHITDQSDLRKYFAQIPHMADDDLDVYQYRLYGHYLRVCGKNGKCTQSVRTTATSTRMSVGMVTKTREQLVELGFIETHTEEGSGFIAITIIDRWLENMLRYAKDSDERSPHERSVHLVNAKRSPGETKNNKNKNNHKEEIKDSAPAAQDAHSTALPEALSVKETEAATTPQVTTPERKSSAKKKEPSAPRPRNPVFDALAQHLFGMVLTDAKAVKAVAPRVGKLMEFAANRVTPDEVPRFVAWYRKHYPKVSLPLDAPKFATRWVEYEKARDAYQAQQQTNNPKISTTDLWDMRAVFDHMTANELSEEGKIK